MENSVLPRARAVRTGAARRPIACRMSSLRNALLCATSLALGTSLAPASAQQPITTPILSSAENFRDIAGISASNGGTGFADTTSNNGVMRTGVIYRSDVLALNGADLATISTLHIALDIDLQDTLRDRCAARRGADRRLLHQRQHLRHRRRRLRRRSPRQPRQSPVSKACTSNLSPMRANERRFIRS